jgi:hypothetical protein
MNDEKLLKWAHANLEYRHGNLWWKVKKTSRRLDVPAGAITRGYRNICTTIDGKKKMMPAHRLIYMMNHQNLPQVVDHIDGNPENNSIENLRAASCAENQWNAKRRSDSSTRIKNVSLHRKTNLWHVQIHAYGKKYQWYFRDIELAELVAKEAREKLHKGFARHW